MGLAEIWAYPAAGTSEVVATNFIGEIESAFEPERLFPLVSPARGTLAPGLRVTHRHDNYIDMVPRQPLMLHRTMRRRPS
jgi:hypothetical protein